MGQIAAKQEAMARCRQDGGELAKASWGTYEFTGAPYDALNVAKDLVLNGKTGVTLTFADGRELGDQEIAAARF